MLVKGGYFGEKQYSSRKEWPEKCGLQFGSLNVSESEDSIFFFEAIINPSEESDRVFIARGESRTIQSAEDKAWGEYQKVLNCANHKFEKKGYTNGIGVCIHCGFKSEVFTPETLCCVCEEPSTYHKDIKDRYYCHNHYYKMEISEYAEKFLYKVPLCEDFLDYENKKSIDSFEFDKRIFNLLAKDDLEDEKSTLYIIIFCTKLYIWIEDERDYINHDFLLSKASKILEFAKENPEYSKMSFYNNEEVEEIIKFIEK